MRPLPDCRAAAAGAGGDGGVPAARCKGEGVRSAGPAWTGGLVGGAAVSGFDCGGAATRAGAVVAATGGGEATGSFALGGASLTIGSLGV